MNEYKLKPCPFCGSLNLQAKPVWKYYVFVACLNCKAAGPVRKTETDAWAAWSERTEE